MSDYSLINIFFIKMILRESTIKYAGYDPEDLKPKSNKRICCRCDICGRVRWVPKSDYRDLCFICGNNTEKHKNEISLKAKERFKNPKNHPMFGKHQTEESKQKNRESHTGKMIGDNHWNFNKHRSEKVKLQISDSLIGRFMREDSPNWKGGIANNRNHLLSNNKCIQLNKRFKGSEGHHIMSGVIVYIPKYIHRSIWHNMKNGKNMKEINEITLDYLLNNI